MARAAKKPNTSDTGSDKFDKASKASRPSSSRTRSKPAKQSDVDTANKAESLVKGSQLDADSKGGITPPEPSPEDKGIFEGIGGRFGVIANAGTKPINSTIGINVFNRKQRTAMGSWKLMQYAVMTGRK